MRSTAGPALARSRARAQYQTPSCPSKVPCRTLSPASFHPGASAPAAVPGQHQCPLPAQRSSRRIGQHHPVASRRQRMHADGHGQRTVLIAAEKLRIGGRGKTGRVQQIQIPQLHLPALHQRRSIFHRIANPGPFAASPPAAARPAASHNPAAPGPLTAVPRPPPAHRDPAATAQPARCNSRPGSPPAKPAKPPRHINFKRGASLADPLSPDETHFERPRATDSLVQ